jgi:hypothetical protein
MMTQEQEKEQFKFERDQVKMEVEDLKIRRDRMMDLVKESQYANRHQQDEKSKWIVEDDSLNLG